MFCVINIEYCTNYQPQIEKKSQCKYFQFKRVLLAGLFYTKIKYVYKKGLNR